VGCGEGNKMDKKTQKTISSHPYHVIARGNESYYQLQKSSLLHPFKCIIR
jgi:hypothetical protein